MELVVYCEGKVSYSELWEMSFTERQLLTKVLNTYIKKKSGDKSNVEDL